jgi:OOP family OmpA-OmpF porin
MKKLFLLVIIIIQLGSFQAQNLIPNAGFEHKNDCPTRISHYATLARGWTNPTHGTPDYYHVCGDRLYQTPTQRYDTKKPYHGDAYIALGNRGNYREYLRIRLISSLRRGTTYKVKLYVSASNDFNYTSSDIGLYFSRENKIQKNTSRLKNASPQIINPKENIIPTNEWIEVCGEFIAKGGEKFVTIGSFREEVTFQATMENPGNIKNSYIYIDNISTVALKRPKEQLPPKWELKTLKSIRFEINQVALNKKSFKELNDLVEKLKEKKSINIEIIGHTDVSGDEEHNLTLSKQRALSIVNYLIKKGISKDRLKHKGLGSSIPINPKDKSNKKALNRRVEFRVID